MEDLYPYYEQELVFIRQMAAEFAKNHPATAARLRLEKDRSADPHVERLIEAFALLAGRVQHKIDDEFPEITESLLGLLYPHYLRPIPSLAIAQFQTDRNVSTPTSGTFIDAGTKLHSRPPDNICTFRTCYPVRTWPLCVTRATLGLPSSMNIPHPGDVSAVLRLELETIGGIPFSKLALQSLRFYLNGDKIAVHTLYELLFTRTSKILLRPASAQGLIQSESILSADALRPVGLSANEGVLPYSDNSFLGYRLLQEHFHYPQKFLFVDLDGLQPLTRPGAGSTAEILICLSPMQRPERLARLEQYLSAELFQLGCTPIINLFDTCAERIQLTQTTTEYRVIPDQHRQLQTEVYSVNKVTSTAPYMEVSQEYSPFYSIRHSDGDDPNRRFWYAHRRPSLRKGDFGSEVFLTLVDLNFKPTLPATEMLTVHVTCTNRDLPGRMNWTGGWGELSVEGIGSINVRCVEKPGPPIRPPARKGLQWRLISHLTLNHLSIVKGGLPALQEILRLYNFSGDEEQSAAINKQINGIVELSSRQSMARMRSDAGVAFCRGTDITLKFDERQYSGTGVFLLASVLERFLGLYAAINSFSRFTAKTNQGVLKQWPPIAGEQMIL
jgi:type VI secretion system protein ImpG